MIVTSQALKTEIPLGANNDAGSLVGLYKLTLKFNDHSTCVFSCINNHPLPHPPICQIRETDIYIAICMIDALIENKVIY